MISKGETRVHTYTDTYTYVHMYTLANLKHKVANFNSEKEQGEGGRISEKRNHEYRESEKEGE